MKEEKSPGEQPGSIRAWVQPAFLGGDTILAVGQ